MELPGKQASDVPDFLRGGGEMGTRMREKDWSATPLGAPATWPQSLKTAISILLNTKFPMVLWWGQDLIQFYNEAYMPSLLGSQKHPKALGQAARECWPERWPVVEPMVQQVLSGQSVYHENQQVSRLRNGLMRTEYWTYSYSAVTDELDKIAGVIIVCNETTSQVEDLKFLKTSSSRFQHLVRQATVGIVVLMGPEMRVEIANDVYGQLTGKRATELTGRELFSVIPEAEQLFRPAIEQVRDTGNPVYLYDQPFPVHSDGTVSEVFLNLVYQPFREDDGAVTGVMVLCHNVTAQVQATKKIEDSHLFARSIIENSPIAQAVFAGPEMTISILNEKMLEIMGRDASVTGKPLLSIMPELNITPIPGRLLQVLNTGITYHQPEEKIALLRYSQPYTGYYNYTLKALKNSAGKNYAVAVTAAEITEQVLTRQAAEQAEGKARLAIDSAGLGTYEIDLATNEMLTSDRFKAIWGVDKDMPRTAYSERIHPDDRIIRERAHQLSETTGFVKYEARLVWKDGSEHWVKVSGKVIFDDDKKPAKLLGVIQDITEQKNQAAYLTRQVQERTTELQRSNDDLLQFAHVASHDLKEPVRKIKIFGTRLQHEYGDVLPEKGSQYLEKVQNAADRMMAMIEGVLSYSAQSSSEQLVEKIDLNNTIKMIESDLEVLINQKAATIECGPLPVIEGAPILIYQLFYNLVNNSLKFTKNGVAPVISIKCDMVTESEKLFARITLADNGIGFEDEYAEKIFYTFTRLNSKDAFEGTGLGLALCKKIVTRHGGSITAYGQKNSGAIFVIDLPALHTSKTLTNI